MKGIIVFFALIIGGMIYFQHSLQNGAILKYIDEHPHGRGVPQATYRIGQGYQVFQNLLEATTYYLRVAQRYPDQTMGDDAYFSYLRCLDEMASVSRTQLVAGYQAYVDKYPNGKHVELAKTRRDTFATGGR